MVNFEFLPISAFTVTSTKNKNSISVNCRNNSTHSPHPKAQSTPSFLKAPVKKSTTARLKHFCPSTGIVRICLLDCCCKCAFSHL